MMGGFLLGSELGEDAVIDRHQACDVGLGLGVGWHAVVFADCFWPGVIGGEGELEAAKGGHLFQKIARATVEVLDWVCRINVQVVSRPGHQLREAKGTGMADSALGVIALDLDHRLEEGGPFGGCKVQSRQSRMVLIAGGNQPNLWQDIPWGCNALGAEGDVDGGFSTLPFPDLFFNRFRADRNNQLTLTVIAQDG